MPKITKLRRKRIKCLDFDTGILGAARCGDYYYGPIKLHKRNTITNNRKINFPKQLSKINYDLWTAANKTSAVFCDIATPWYRHHLYQTNLLLSNKQNNTQPTECYTKPVRSLWSIDNLAYGFNLDKSRNDICSKYEHMRIQRRDTLLDRVRGGTSTYDAVNAPRKLYDCHRHPPNDSKFKRISPEFYYILQDHDRKQYEKIENRKTKEKKVQIETKSNKKQLKKSAKPINREQHDTENDDKTHMKCEKPKTSENSKPLRKSRSHGYMKKSQSIMLCSQCQAQISRNASRSNRLQAHGYTQNLKNYPCCQKFATAEKSILKKPSKLPQHIIWPMLCKDSSHKTTTVNSKHNINKGKSQNETNTKKYHRSPSCTSCHSQKHTPTSSNHICNKDSKEFVCTTKCTKKLHTTGGKSKTKAFVKKSSKTNIKSSDSSILGLATKIVKTSRKSPTKSKVVGKIPNCRTQVTKVNSKMKTQTDSKVKIQNTKEKQIKTGKKEKPCILRAHAYALFDRKPKSEAQNNNSCKRGNCKKCDSESSKKKMPMKCSGLEQQSSVYIKTTNYGTYHCNSAKKRTPLEISRENSACRKPTRSKNVSLNKEKKSEECFKTTCYNRNSEIISIDSSKSILKKTRSIGCSCNIKNSNLRK